MNYLCIDRGSIRCPCRLMDAGQCYTCTMTAKEICSCENKTGWQGVCPYTEWVQQGMRCRNQPAHQLRSCPVEWVKDWGQNLHVICLAVPAGLAEDCRMAGTFLMAEALGWRTPLSVLRIRTTGRTGQVEVLLKTAGPKTMELLRTAKANEPVWRIAGPYTNGLLNMERKRNLRDWPRLVIARGAAAAPLFHYLEERRQLDNLEDPEEIPAVYLDRGSLPEEFTEEYMEGISFESIDLNDPDDRSEMADRIRMQGADNTALLVSNWFWGRLLTDFSEEEQAKVVYPNSANLFCGEGVCGACSHTEGDGVTVRLCKCTETVVE